MRIFVKMVYEKLKSAKKLNEYQSLMKQHDFELLYLV
jgi:hypothetical protein